VPAWQRLIITLGGVFVNLVVGVLLFALVIGKYEKQYLPNDAVTDGIYAYEAARNMGFQTGDKIISVNGKTKERFKDIVSPKMFFGGIVIVERSGKKMNIVIDDSAYALMKGGKTTFFVDAANYAIIIDSVIKDLPADKAGMQKADKILSINDTLPIFSYGSLTENLRLFPNQQISVACVRNADTVYLEITPDSLGIIGIFCLPPSYHFKPYSIGQSIEYGWKDAMNAIYLNIKGLGKIVSGEEKTTSISGPIGIAQFFGKEWIWSRFWRLVGLLSVILAFMNLLPIPGLDGGHAIFTIVELITGRKVSDKVLQAAQTVGMFILLLLMVFVLGNDIFKVIFN